MGKMDSESFRESLPQKRSEICDTVKSWVKDYLIHDSGESFLGLLGASECVMRLLHKPEVTRALCELASESPTLARAVFLYDDELTWQGEHFTGYIRGVLAALKIVDEQLAALNLCTLGDEDRQPVEKLIKKVRTHRKEFLREFIRISASEDLYQLLGLYGQTVHRYIVEVCKKLLIHALDDRLYGFLEWEVTRWMNQSCS